MNEVKAVKVIGATGGAGTLATGVSLLFVKCPLCYLAMGMAAAASFWPLLVVMLLPALAFVVIRMCRPGCREACAKQLS
jgi:hypothetical protein